MRRGRCVQQSEAVPLPPTSPTQDPWNSGCGGWRFPGACAKKEDLANVERTRSNIYQEEDLHSRTLAIFAAILLGQSVQLSALSIDEFDGETTLTTTSFTIDGSMIGGERDVDVGSGASFSSTGGQITYNSLTGINRISLIYDGEDNDPALGFGLGGVDLTVGGADRFILSVTGIVSNPSISLTVHDSSGNSSRSGPQNVSTTGLFEFTFASFTFDTGLGASLSNANAFQVTLSDNVASGGPGSLTLDYLRTNGDMSAVPEPSSFALMGLGLAAFGIWRRKKPIC